MSEEGGSQRKSARVKGLSPATASKPTSSSPAMKTRAAKGESGGEVTVKKKQLPARGTRNDTVTGKVTEAASSPVAGGNVAATGSAGGPTPGTPASGNKKSSVGAVAVESVPQTPPGPPTSGVGAVARKAANIQKDPDGTMIYRRRSSVGSRAPDKGEGSSKSSTPTSRMHTTRLSTGSLKEPSARLEPSPASRLRKRSTSHDSDTTTATQSASTATPTTPTGGTPTTPAGQSAGGGGAGVGVGGSGPSPKKRRLTAKPPPASGRQDNHNDFYCWQCHGEGRVICCELCPRVYHLKCLGMEKESEGEWACPECEKVMRAECADSRSKAMSLITIDQLCLLLKYALQRMKCQGSEPFQKAVDTSNFPNYSDYIFHPVDIALLERNIKKKQYGSTEAFLADAKWILHNCIIFNGKHNKLTSVAKTIIKIAKHEMNEIEICPDCYFNSCTKRGDNWFCEPCRVPHTLVWAKMRGYPFWPAKALRVVKDQVDCRFFGEHDRAWVQVSSVFLLSEECPVLAKKKAHGFDQSIEEMTVHIARIRDKFGSFEYAPTRTQYDPAHKYAQKKFRDGDGDSLKQEEDTESMIGSYTQETPDTPDTPEDPEGYPHDDSQLDSPTSTHPRKTLGMGRGGHSSRGSVTPTVTRKESQSVRTAQALKSKYSQRGGARSIITTRRGRGRGGRGGRGGSYEGGGGLEEEEEEMETQGEEQKPVHQDLNISMESFVKEGVDETVNLNLSRESNLSLEKKERPEASAEESGGGRTEASGVFMATEAAVEEGVSLKSGGDTNVKPKLPDKNIISKIEAKVKKLNEESLVEEGGNLDTASADDLPKNQRHGEPIKTSADKPPSNEKSESTPINEKPDSVKPPANEKPDMTKPPANEKSGQYSNSKTTNQNEASQSKPANDKAALSELNDAEEPKAEVVQGDPKKNPFLAKIVESCKEKLGISDEEEILEKSKEQEVEDREEGEITSSDSGEESSEEESDDVDNNKKQDSKELAAREDVAGKQKCVYCPQEFDSPRLLDHHVSTDHPPVRPYTCHMCHKAFAWRGKVINHLKVAHKMSTGDYDAFIAVDNELEKTSTAKATENQQATLLKEAERQQEERIAPILGSIRQVAGDEADAMEEGSESDNESIASSQSDKLVMDLDSSREKPKEKREEELRRKRRVSPKTGKIVKRKKKDRAADDISASESGNTGKEGKTAESYVMKTGKETLKLSVGQLRMLEAAGKLKAPRKKDELKNIGDKVTPTRPGGDQDQAAMDIESDLDTSQDANSAYADTITPQKSSSQATEEEDEDEEIRSYREQMDSSVEQIVSSVEQITSSMEQIASSTEQIASSTEQIAPNVENEESVNAKKGDALIATDEQDTGSTEKTQSAIDITTSKPKEETSNDATIEESGENSEETSTKRKRVNTENDAKNVDSEGKISKGVMQERQSKEASEEKGAKTQGDSVREESEKGESKDGQNGKKDIEKIGDDGKETLKEKDDVDVKEDEQMELVEGTKLINNDEEKKEDEEIDEQNKGGDAESNEQNNTDDLANDGEKKKTTDDGQRNTDDEQINTDDGQKKMDVVQKKTDDVQKKTDDVQKKTDNLLMDAAQHKTVEKKPSGDGQKKTEDLGGDREKTVEDDRASQCGSQDEPIPIEEDDEEEEGIEHDKTKPKSASSSEASSGNAAAVDTDANRRVSTWGGRKGKVSPPQSGVTLPDVHNLQMSTTDSVCDLNKYTDQVMASVKIAMENMAQDLLAKQAGQAMKSAFTLELEKLKWKHEQELGEIKHNAAVQLAEMRLSFERNQRRTMEEQLRQLAQEKDKAVLDTKKKQWCAQCRKEAIFYCCWNTSYCDYSCQQEHWPQHMATCTQTAAATGQSQRPGEEGGPSQSPMSGVGHQISNVHPQLPQSNSWTPPAGLLIPTTRDQARENLASVLSRQITSPQFNSHGPAATPVSIMTSMQQQQAVISNNTSPQPMLGGGNIMSGGGGVLPGSMHVAASHYQGAVNNSHYTNNAVQFPRPIVPQAADNNMMYSQQQQHNPPPILMMQQQHQQQQQNSRRAIQPQPGAIDLIRGPMYQPRTF